MGDDKEDFRWNFLIKNKRARDNFENVMAVARAFDLSGTALDNALEEVIDLNQWMRVYAMHSLTSQLDVYGIDAAPHNLWLYDHPGTGKIMAMPWDMDFAFSSRRPSHRAAAQQRRMFLIGTSAKSSIVPRASGSSSEISWT